MYMCLYTDYISTMSGKDSHQFTNYMIFHVNTRIYVIRHLGDEKEKLYVCVYS